LINIDLRGASAWGGGPEGMNASLSSVVVLAALLAVTLAWPSAQPSSSPRFRASALKSSARG
jgi:hypothetical protein